MAQATDREGQVVSLTTIRWAHLFFTVRLMDYDVFIDSNASHTRQTHQPVPLIPYITLYLVRRVFIELGLKELYL